MKFYFSSLHDPKWNGGRKAYNVWVNKLNEMGIESYYIPNHEGKVTPWLVNPCNSTSVPAMLNSFNRDEDIFVTTWLDEQVTSLIVQHSLPFIYMDLEWKWTSYFSDNVKHLLNSSLYRKYFTHSSHIKKLAKIHFGVDASVINEWSDSTIFYYDSALKKRGTIGYTKEENSEHIISILKENQFIKDNFSFVKIDGDEAEFGEKLRKCEYFLGTNQGKYFDSTLGIEAEGCPRTQQEALHCGCILLAKDVVGNREYLVHGKTGFFINFGNIEAIVEILQKLENDKESKDYIITLSQEMVEQLFKNNDNKTSVIRAALEI